MARKISPGVYFGLYDKTALAEYVPAFVNPIKPKKHNPVVPPKPPVVVPIDDLILNPGYFPVNSDINTVLSTIVPVYGNTAPTDISFSLVSDDDDNFTIELTQNMMDGIDPIGILYATDIESTITFTLPANVNNNNYFRISGTEIYISDFSIDMNPVKLLVVATDTNNAFTCMELNLSLIDPSTRYTVEVTVSAGDMVDFTYLSGSEATIDWGDGNVEVTTSTSITHYYGADGVYIIKTKGMHPDNQGHYLSDSSYSKLTRILYWGDLMNGITNASNLYGYSNNLISIPSNWKGWGSVTNMQETFYQCSSLTEVRTWRGLNNLTEAYETFYGCTLLTTIPTSWIGLDNLTAAEFMFAYTGILALPDTWDHLGKLNDANGMFNSCESLTSIPDSWVGLTSMENLSKVFYGCSSLTTIPDSWVGLETVISVNSLFDYCQAITSIPDSWVGLGNTTDIAYIFEGCELITAIPDSWTPLSKIELTVNAFNRCRALVSIPNTWLGLNNVTNCSGMFSGCTSLPSSELPPSYDGLQNVYHAGNMFNGCTTLTYTPDWVGLDSVVYTTAMFKGCTSLVDIKTSFFETPATTTVLPLVTHVYQMFFGCTALTDNITNLYQYLNTIRSIPSYSGTNNPVYGGCFYNCKLATGYSSLSSYWKSNIYV